MDATIRRTLEKVPADRFTGAQDFMRALADPAFRHGPAVTSAAVAPASRALKQAMAALAAVSVVLTVLVVSQVVSGGSPSDAGAVVWFDPGLPEAPAVGHYVGAPL